MKKSIKEGIQNTFIRELKRMKSRPIYVFSGVFVMLFCYVFFLTFFKEGSPHKMPVGVVDLDQSTVSRTFIRNINASSQIDLVTHYTCFGDARNDMQQGKIYAFVVIPKNFYSKALSYNQPEITFYVNDAYLIAGSLLYKDLLYMSSMGSAYMQIKLLEAKGVNEWQIMGTVQPISIDTHLISNPWVNYGIYLLNVILPGMLQLMVLTLTVFSIGMELKERTSRNWLRTSNNYLWVALLGKLLPYTILFTVLGIGGNLILYKYMHFPFHGSFLRICIATFLFIIAHQAIGIVMIGILPVLRDGISLVAIFGLFGISFAGFSFPVEGMPYPIQIFSEFFPLRHYFKIYSNEALLGGSFSYTFVYYIVLLAYLLLPFLIYGRLKKAALYLNYPSK